MSTAYIIYPNPETRPKVVGARVGGQVTIDLNASTASGFMEKLVRVATGSQPSSFQAISSEAFRVHLTKNQRDSIITLVEGHLETAGKVQSGSNVTIHTGTL